MHLVNLLSRLGLIARLREPPVETERVLVSGDTAKRLTDSFAHLYAVLWDLGDKILMEKKLYAESLSGAWMAKRLTDLFAHLYAVLWECRQTRNVINKYVIATNITLGI